MAKKNNPKAEKAKRNKEYAKLHKKKPARPSRFGPRSGPRPAPAAAPAAPQQQAPAESVGQTQPE